MEHKVNHENQAKNPQTKQYETAIPEPLYQKRLFSSKFVCECGHSFKAKEDYAKHYRVVINKSLGQLKRYGNKNLVAQIA